MAVLIGIFFIFSVLLLVSLSDKIQERKRYDLLAEVAEIRNNKVVMFDYEEVVEERGVKEGFTAFKNAVLKNHISYYEYRLMCDRDSGYQNLYKRVESLQIENSGFEYDLTKGYEIDLELVAVLETDGTVYM